MIRKEIYTIDEVLNEVKPYNPKEGKRFVQFGDDLMKMESQRYRLFKRDGVKCVKCQIEGKFFRKERHKHDTQYHFNLYALDANGNEVLMTKDHIIAKANGGKNNLTNYQVLCYPCNHNKGKK
jgi:5-methylcytosine-specific restriction endonuclease McrA